MQETTLKIEGDFITLTQAMKAATWVESGAMAGAYIVDGLVFVNGAVELQKRKKLVPGDEVECEEMRLILT